MTASAKAPFWEVLAQYLRDFLADLSSADDGPLLGEGRFWWRASKGWVQLSAAEYSEYREFLSRASQALAPDGDLSESALDAALQAALLDVADPAGTGAPDAERRIREAVENFRAIVEGPAQEYECWLEVDGLRTETLPAEFARTQFRLLGDQTVAHLTDIVRTKHTVDSPGKLDSIERMRDDIAGRPIAIQRVTARDDKAAMSLATRNVRTAIECLNFFADLLPYNRHRLRVDEVRAASTLRVGEARTPVELRMTVAADGSFWHSPRATKPGTFSFERLRELTGPAGEAVSRVEALLLKEDRSEVDELLLRTTRWMGRAADADSAEDQFLFSMIALECAVLPTQTRNKGKEISVRIANMLTEDAPARRNLRKEIERD